MTDLKHWDTACLRSTETADRREATRRRSATNVYRRGSDARAVEQDAIALRHEQSADRMAAEIARREARRERLEELRAEALRRSQSAFRAERTGGGPTTCTDHGAFIDGDGTEAIARCEHRFAHEAPHGGEGRTWA